MSELVEKVASKLARTPLEQCDDEFRNTPFWSMCEADARLAIAAVAEWLESQSQFDGDGKGVLSAALRAAAGSSPTRPEVK